MGHLLLRHLAVLMSKVISKLNKSLSRGRLAMSLVPEIELRIFENDKFMVETEFFSFEIKKFSFGT